MPVNRPALALGATPRSVADARRWVGEICHELGRADLADAAELGVSELVTNALLHGAPPISVRVRGTHQHPRIEVTDGSPEPPVVGDPLVEQDDVLATYGRGLGILASCSTAWGAALEQSGKVVWFVPSDAASSETSVEGDIFHLEQPVPSPSEVAGPDPVTVRMLDLPVRTYVDFRSHYRELRRELHVLALAHESAYPVAKNLSDLFSRFEAEVPSLVGSEILSEALEGGAETVDLDVAAPSDSGDTVGQMLQLLELADDFCRTERLLALSTSPELGRFRRWYLGEFVRQCDGHAPMPWPEATPESAGQRSSSASS